MKEAIFDYKFLKLDIDIKCVTSYNKCVTN